MLTWSGYPTASASVSTHGRKPLTGVGRDASGGAALAVQLADPSPPFRATMAYRDHPGSSIHNRLYLHVVDPVGAIHDGDVTVFPKVTTASSESTSRLRPPDVHDRGARSQRALRDRCAPRETRQDFALAVRNGLGFSLAPI